MKCNQWQLEDDQGHLQDIRVLNCSGDKEDHGYCQWHDRDPHSIFFPICILMVSFCKLGKFLSELLSSPSSLHILNCNLSEGSPFDGKVYICRPAELLHEFLAILHDFSFLFLWLDLSYLGACFLFGDIHISYIFPYGTFFQENDKNLRVVSFQNRRCKFLCPSVVLLNPQLVWVTWR